MRQGITSVHFSGISAFFHVIADIPGIVVLTIAADCSIISLEEQ
jgi:hypothetical protein